MRRIVFFLVLITAATAALSQAPSVSVPNPRLSESSVRLLQKDEHGRLELWRTRLGDLWIPMPGRYVIAHLDWEQSDQKIYDFPAVHVQPGDVVVDCGAHIGAFTRVALRAGARMVIAIEPETANVAAFKRNFENELRTGAVRLVAKGVWHEPGKLALRLSSSSNDSHSLLLNDKNSARETIELITLDNLARELKLSRIDFIKMDIEGAESNALRGARRVLQQWRPRLAISAYHLKGDPAKIASIIWDARSDYRIGSKDVIRVPQGVVPKVLFFY